tara:strand:+ start:111 stop:578 length:468 start_codon:yes stop_codon:yes gene_type:complete
MAKKIIEGSLICAKRNVQGLGIVLERVKDINLYAEFDLSEAFLRMYDESHPDYEEPALGSMIYNARYDEVKRINAKIIEKKSEVDMSVLEAFWSHNKAYSKVMMPERRKKSVLKPKVDFCLVHWMKAPSDYGDVPARWYVSKGPVWMISTSLKNR